MGAERRVVVTGMGALTPLNSGFLDLDKLVEEYWEGLIAGKSGIKKIEDSNRVNLAGFSVNIGALIPFDISDYHDFFTKRELRRTDRFTQYALIAAHGALIDAELLDYSDKDRIGVIVGTGVGGLTTTEDQKEELTKGLIEPRRIDLNIIPKIMVNAAAGNIAIKYGFAGPNYSTSSACASSAHAIYDAALNILAGKADIIVTGGAECAITQLGYGGFSNMKALSKNPDPEKASRPFDKNRDGFVLGEGSAILVLEGLESAKKRGAKIYAELLASYANCDASHITAPHKDGAQIKKAMRSALDEADLIPEQIGYINAHGTSTPLNDRIESQAIIEVFGEYAFDGLLVSSTKSMTGHLLGAAPAIEAIASIKALRTGIVPPTINYETHDPDLADSNARHLDYVPNKAKEKGLEAVMSNSFGFGGHNAVLVFGKYPE